MKTKIREPVTVTREGGRERKHHVRELHEQLVAVGFAEELSAICKGLHVALFEVLGGGRDASTTEARRACAAYLRAKGLSLPRIGKLIGRDHTSVRVMLQPAEERAARNLVKKIQIGMSESKGRAA